MAGALSVEYAFLSYSRRDQAFAARLAQDLRARGIRLWFDQLDIPPGANWDVEIHRALHGARAVLFIVSESSVASDNVLNELSVALETGKWIIPIMIANVTVPLRITRLQRIDFVSDYAAGLTKLAAFMMGGGSRTYALEAIAAGVPGIAPPAVPSPSLEPMQREIHPRPGRSSWVLPAILGAMFGSVALVVGGLFLLGVLSGNQPSPGPSSSAAAAAPKPTDEPTTASGVVGLQGHWVGPCRPSNRGSDQVSIRFLDSGYGYEVSYFKDRDCSDEKVTAHVEAEVVGMRPRGGGYYEAEYRVLDVFWILLVPAAELNREGFLGVRQWRDGVPQGIAPAKVTEIFGTPLRQGTMIYDLPLVRGNTLRLGRRQGGTGFSLSPEQRPTAADEAVEFHRE